MNNTQTEGRLRPNYVLYEQLLVGCLDKIRKTIPKKCKELRDACGEAIELVKADADDETLSANKYFRIMKLALDAKIPRLTEQILYHVQKLVAHGLLDGNYPDDCLYPPGEEKPKSNGTLPRRLIDAIVDEVCKCTTERDQQVQLQVVRALLTIVATSATEVHERSLLKVMSSLYYIHIACTNQVNQNTAKASLIQMISIVFKKMEQHSGDFSESLRRLNSGEGAQGLDSARGGLSEAMSGGTQPNETRTSQPSARQQRPQGQSALKEGTDSQEQPANVGSGSGREGPASGHEEVKGEGTHPSASSADQTLVTFTAEEQYAHVTLTYLVDSVCLHAAKVEEVKKTYQDEIRALQDAGQQGEQLTRLVGQMQEEEGSIALFSVPRSSKARRRGEGQDGAQEKTATPANKRLVDKDAASLELVNELGIPSGKFGWCVSCRASANLYCKHTRHPVCSFECKQRHIKLLEEASASHEDVSTPSTSAGSGQLLEEPHSRDALLVFNKLCQLLQSKDLDGKLDNVYDVRKVLLGLDLIHSCLENPGSTFINRREFVAVIRDSLCSALLKFAVSSEHKIFSRTVSIFYCLFLHFREHLKQTISVFIDNFFRRILESGNSEYDYKYSILEFFDRLSENADHVLEIFANYDCDIGQKDICVRVVDSLSSIAQGRFQRSEHASVITGQQEASLRRQALEILVKILRNLNRTIEAEVRLEGLAQARLAESRHERATMLRKAESTLDSRHDEDDSNSRGDLSLMMEQEADSDAPINERKANGPGIAGQAEDQATAESMDAKQQMQNRLYKSEMNKAAGKFNLKPKNGLKYLTDKGYLPKEPKEEMLKGICKFLKGTPALSATAIGEFLGGDPELNREALSYYIDDLDFTSKDLGFVDALKLLLQGFRIPGEGQQVDRFMEKFGEKLSRDRPEEFGNAEGVYLLAYATLMLQTSVHNPQAQKLKMTLSDFRKITTGVKLSEGGTMDFDAFLEDVYDTVVREPFTLEEDEDARMKLESAAGTNKKLLFDKEREGILRRGTGLLKQDNKNNRFVLIKDISTIRPMFENTWSANLAVFSVVLDETEDPIIADLCLQGFMHAVRISGHFEIHDVRNAFVSSLSKFTQVSATKEIKQKNINCIRELLNLAIHNGDCLRDSWSYVLECISKIDHMRVLGLGDLTDSEYFQSEAGAASQGQPLNQQLLMRNSAIIAEQIDANQIETIFLQSERLNTDAIIDFIENLCRVSKDELADEDSPKKFCLQKLVEVASLNMNRVRFQWQSIWRTLGEHFTWVGSHKNLHVIIYAIDSLRQLADKFLEKEERKNFSYQKMFLKPFETIMLNNLHSRQKEIKEYIVMCMAALCHQKAKFIKSGWEVILSIFALAAQDTEMHLVVQSFQSLEHAVLNHFPLLEECFLELVSCLSEFSRNGAGPQSSKALGLLRVCGRQLRGAQTQTIVDSYVLSQGQSLHLQDLEIMRQNAVYGIQNQFRKLQQSIPGSSKEKSADSKTFPNGPATAEAVRLSTLKELWFPILRNFTSLIAKKDENVRNEALDAFEKTLEEHHAHFGESLWREIVSQVIFPVLEDIRLQVELATRKNNLEHARHHVMVLQQLLVCLNRFFSEKQSSLPPALLTCYTDILCLFASNINNQDLASVVMEQLKHLLVDIGARFSGPEQWSDVVEQISLLFQMSVPSLLVDEMQSFQSQEIPEMIDNTNEQLRGHSGSDSKQKYEQCYAKCTTQLLLTKVVSEVISKFFDRLSLEQIQILLQSLDSQYKFAKEFNSEITLRVRLWKAGYMSQLDHLPGLLAHEEESLKVYLSILFKQFFKEKDGQAGNDVAKPLFALCSKVLKDYVLKHSELISIKTSKQSQREAAAKAPGGDAQLSALQQQQQQLETELDKQLSHQSPIVHQVILENLLNLQDADLHANVRDLGQLLIDLTLCGDHQVRSKNHKLLSRIFEHLQSKTNS